MAELDNGIWDRMAAKMKRGDRLNTEEQAILTGYMSFEELERRNKLLSILDEYEAECGGPPIKGDEIDTPEFIIKCLVDFRYDHPLDPNRWCIYEVDVLDKTQGKSIIYTRLRNGELELVKGREEQ